MSRTIVIVVHDGNAFDVIENGRSADLLAWDEMLGQVAALTHPDIKGPRYRMDSIQELRDQLREARQREKA